MAMQRSAMTCMAVTGVCCRNGLGVTRRIDSIHTMFRHRRWRTCWTGVRVMEQLFSQEIYPGIAIIHEYIFLKDDNLLAFEGPSNAHGSISN
jgi:hypothetical protein